MSKPITEKLIAAGIVDKTMTAMLDRWGQLAPGEYEKLTHKQVVTETLESFIEGLEEILEAEKPLRETRLEIPVKRPPVELYSPKAGVFSAVEDEMGRLIVGPGYQLERGWAVWGSHQMSGHPATMQVLDVEPLYEGDRIFAYQITVQRFPKE
jgi:hypothetical protein